LAESEVLAALASALELHRGVEFLVDLNAVVGDCQLVVRGIIDILFRDAAGWHVLAIDLGTTDEDDPWRGRRPGLVLQAWAVSHQLGDWPATVELFDLATGQLVAADPRRVKPAAVVSRFAALLEGGPPRRAAPPP